MHGPERQSIVEFSESRFPFRAWMENLWETTDLENLHTQFKVTLENYVASVRKFQRRCDDHAEEISGSVSRFLEEIVEPRLGKRIAHRQSTPTFRAHFAIPGAELKEHERLAFELAPDAFLKKYYWREPQQQLSGFHKDSSYGLPANAVNVWVALTDSYGTNSLWLANLEDDKQVYPIEVSRGCALLFCGASRLHGTVCNTSSKTRVSLDLRVL